MLAPLGELFSGEVSAFAQLDPTVGDARPKLEALRTLLGIAERRARLLGLDTPTKRQVEVISESAVDAEIARLSVELEARGVDPDELVEL